MVGGVASMPNSHRKTRRLTGSQYTLDLCFKIARENREKLFNEIRREIRQLIGLE
jgi:hypothetical protein